jgi:hypothetical protein
MSLKMNPILKLRGGREYDLEQDADVTRLGLGYLSLEDKLAMALDHIEQLQTMIGKLMEQKPTVEPAAPIDTTPVLQQILMEMQSGNRRIVTALLADTVLRHDPITGEPERSIKVIKE